MAGVGVVLRPHTQPSHGTTRPDGLDGRPLVRMAPCGRLRQGGRGEMRGDPWLGTHRADVHGSQP